MVKEKEKRFPTFAWLVLVFGVIWLLQELKFIKFDVPWLPIIVIVVSVGMIINHNL